MSRPLILAEKNNTTTKIDLNFLLMVIVFCGIGLITLYSGSTGYANRIYGNPLYFFDRQLKLCVVGLCLMLMAAYINLDFIRNKLPIIFVISLILNFLPFAPYIGVHKNGASRWINVGFTTLQPSELLKLTLVFFLANLFAKKNDKINDFNATLIPSFTVIFLFAFIVYLQDDFSTAVIIFVLGVLMFILVGVSINNFIKVFLIIAPFVFIMIFSKAYRVERIISFLHPNKDPQGASYQVNASLQALRNGGFWGMGLGNGVKKISGIPEVQSDFIFAVWGEEMGFLGVLLYFLILMYFAFCGFRISLKSSDRFRSLLAFGCTSTIFIQSLVNCGVIVRLLPATGIPLPFFSSGGSSLVITLIFCGIVLNVSRYKKYGDLEND